MKLATVDLGGESASGVVSGDSFYSFRTLNATIPDDMLTFIEDYDRFKPLVDEGLDATVPTAPLSAVRFLAPLPHPRTIRDFVGFEEHAKNAGAHFGMDLSATLEVWRTAPGFYYSNPNCVSGQDEPVPNHPRSQWFDFEFEVGFVIGKRGRDIPAADANDYIFGLTIFNDWSARDIQLQEMQLGVGAPKSKEYANTIGPVIVTMDEILPRAVEGDPLRFDLPTRLVRNGQLLRENNVSTIHYPFAVMIEWASRDTDIVPGDLFGSGTLGGGSIAEYPPETPWLAAGDVIEMTVDGIGTLTNTIV